MELFRPFFDRFIFDTYRYFFLIQHSRSFNSGIPNGVKNIAIKHLVFQYIYTTVLNK